jgi:hypothetical protein
MNDILLISSSGKSFGDDDVQNKLDNQYTQNNYVPAFPAFEQWGFLIITHYRERLLTFGPSGAFGFPNETMFAKSL